MVCNKTFKLLVRCQRLSDRFQPSMYDLAYEAAGDSHLACLVVQMTVSEIPSKSLNLPYSTLLSNTICPWPTFSPSNIGCICYNWCLFRLFVANGQPSSGWYTPDYSVNYDIFYNAFRLFYPYHIQDIADTLFGSTAPIQDIADQLWRHEIGMIMCAPVLLTLGLARNLDSLKWTSAAGSVLIFVCLLFVVVELYCRHPLEYDPDLKVWLTDNGRSAGRWCALTPYQKIITDAPSSILVYVV